MRRSQIPRATGQASEAGTEDGGRVTARRRKRPPDASELRGNGAAPGLVWEARGKRLPAVPPDLKPYPDLAVWE